LGGDPRFETHPDTGKPTDLATRGFNSSESEGFSVPKDAKKIWATIQHPKDLDVHPIFTYTLWLFNIAMEIPHKWRF